MLYCCKFFIFYFSADCPLLDQRIKTSASGMTMTLLVYLMTMPSYGQLKDEIAIFRWLWCLYTVVNKSMICRKTRGRIKAANFRSGFASRAAVVTERCGSGRFPVLPAAFCQEKELRTEKKVNVWLKKQHRVTLYFFDVNLAITFSTDLQSDINLQSTEYDAFLRRI
jgi:hypothetical protein